MKNPLAIFAILLALTAGGGWLTWNYFVSPEIERRDAERKKNTDLQKRLDEAKNAEKRYNDLVKQIEQMMGDLEKLKLFLPVEEKMGVLLANLQRVAQESSLRIPDIVPQATSTDRGYYSERLIKITIVGGYHDVASYFDKIGRFRRIITIRNPQFIRSTGSGSLGGKLIQAQFEAYTYLQKPMDFNPKPAGAPTGK